MKRDAKGMIRGYLSWGAGACWADAIGRSRRAAAGLDNQSCSLLDYWIIINPNDNAIRFAAPNAANLSPTLNEGDTVEKPIHLTNYAYNDPFRHDLARAYNLCINVPSNFKDDISFENVDAEKLSWNDTNKIFKIRTRPVTTLGTPPNIPNSPPVLSASLRVLVKKDERSEMAENIPITMETAANSNIPGYWGSINAAPDDRATNPLKVSTTFNINILSNDTFVGFAENAPAELVEESDPV